MSSWHSAAALLVPVALSLHCTPPTSLDPAPPGPGPGSEPAVATPPQSPPETDEAVAALQEGRFGVAGELATAALAQRPSDGRAAAVRALARYQTAGERLRDVLEELDLDEASFDRSRQGFDDFHRALGGVVTDLETVARDESFALELCLACWERDWNHSGEIDDGDRRLFQVEIDGEGNELPPDDPRRKPTFRLDVGDAHWAIAMMSFQRGVIDILLAYRWRDALAAARSDEPKITVRLSSKERVASAKQSFLRAIVHAEASRRAYLAETDDDREWVPNPRQKSHPLPLPVDDALYETWAAVLVDAHDLLEGTEGLDVAEIAQLGDRQWTDPPRGFIDVASMLDQPRDLTFDVAQLDAFERNRTRASATALLKSTLGPHYVAQMKPTELLGRLRRMRDEVDRGEDSLERKLRYFLWLN